jgi:HEAT repeat protein
LLPLVTHADPRVRTAAVTMLQFLSPPADPDVVESLRSAINDPNDYVVQAALYTLGHQKCEEGRADVCTCLSDNNPHVVQAAVWAASQLGPEHLGEQFLCLLESENTYVRQAAVQGIVTLGYRPAGPHVLATLRACHARDAGAARDYEARACIRALAQLGVREAAELLCSVAADPDAVGLRSTAVEGIIALGFDDAAPALAGSLPRFTCLPSSCTYQRFFFGRKKGFGK